MAEGVCVVGMRDLADEEDVFDAFDAETGERLWRHSYPAPGSLDYGNASRATPLIRDGVVYLFGALGHLSALDVTTGDLLWEKDLAQEYDPPELPWGLAGTPLLVGDLLVVQPAGARHVLWASMQPRGMNAGRPPVASRATRRSFTGRRRMPGS